jgi:putative flippase GtrA
MQLFLYLIVGGLSFFVDIGTFIVLRAIEVPVIPASVVSFSLATVANYLLCVVLAFERGRFRRSIETVRFLTVALIGLGLNTLLVWYLSIRFHFTRPQRRSSWFPSCWSGTISGGAYSCSATKYPLLWAPG